MADLGDESYDFLRNGLQEVTYYRLRIVKSDSRLLLKLAAGIVGGRQLGTSFLSRQLEELDCSCSRFLECMRHSSAFELVQRVKSFVNSFMGTQGTADNCSQLVKRFVMVRCFIVLHKLLVVMEPCTV